MRPLFKTLGELRRDLAVSIGFGAMAGAVDVQIPILNQFLQQAQMQLWRDVNWLYLHKRHQEDLGIGQSVLDLPDDAPLGNISGVYARRNGTWEELQQGIPKEECAYNYGSPHWYGISARQYNVPQVEFFPVPNDKPVSIRIEYYAQTANFKNDDDRASVPDDLLLTLAIVMAKGHYRQPDVQLYADRFSKMLQHAKAENFGSDGETCSPRRLDYDPYRFPVRD